MWIFDNFLGENPHRLFLISDYQLVISRAVAPSRHAPQIVRKVLARPKYSVPLYKARSGFSILNEDCLTFRTVSPVTPETLT